MGRRAIAIAAKLHHFSPSLMVQSLPATNTTFAVCGLTQPLDLVVSAALGQPRASGRCEPAVADSSRSTVRDQSPIGSFIARRRRVGSVRNSQTQPRRPPALIHV